MATIHIIILNETGSDIEADSSSLNNAVWISPPANIADHTAAELQARTSDSTFESEGIVQFLLQDLTHERIVLTFPWNKHDDSSANRDWFKASAHYKFTYSVPHTANNKVNFTITINKK